MVMTNDSNFINWVWSSRISGVLGNGITGGIAFMERHQKDITHRMHIPIIRKCTEQAC